MTAKQDLSETIHISVDFILKETVSKLNSRINDVNSQSKRMMESIKDNDSKIEKYRSLITKIEETIIT